MPDSPQAFLCVDLHLKMNISVSQRELAELHAAGMQAAVVGFRVRPKPIPCVVWMSALAVLSGTGMLITTFRANSLLLKALLAFTFTCSQMFAFRKRRTVYAF